MTRHWSLKIEAFEPLPWRQRMRGRWRVSSSMSVLSEVILPGIVRGLSVYRNKVEEVGGTRRDKTK